MRLETLVQTTSRLNDLREPYALATVISVRGSASAKPGSKAVINHHGINLHGWVGGGCAESFVCQQALEAIKENQSRIITANLDDEVLGLGIPCGGMMDIYIEPVLPQRTLQIDGKHPYADRLLWLAEYYGYKPLIQDDVWRRPQAKHFLNEEHCLQKALLDFVKLLAKDRNVSMESLSQQKGFHRFKGFEEPLENPVLYIKGHSRISEELARLASQLRWNIVVNSSRVQKENYPLDVTFINQDLEEFACTSQHVIVIASHSPDDFLWLNQTLQSPSQYVGFIASTHRTKLALESFTQELSPEAFEKLQAPCGLDLKCQNPAEIALSIVAEILLMNDHASVNGYL